MTPVEKVHALYTPDSPRTFREDLEAYMLTGYVFSTPDLFVMARPVDSRADPQDINNPWYWFPPDECDTWYIYVLATADTDTAQGLVKKILRTQPYPLPLTAWERIKDKSGRLRFFEIRKLENKFNQNKRS